MPREPRAARRLINEINIFVPDLDVDADDLDGLGVYRTHRLTSQGFKGLADVITAVADERIVQSRSITGGVEVTFVADRRADDNKPFGVPDAASLLSKKAKPRKRAAAKPKDAD